MGYEVEAISQGTPVQAPAVMREERTFEPYRVPAPKNVSTPAPVKSEESEVQSKVTLSPQVAALARKEQKFRQEQQKLKTERDQIAAERQELAQLRAMKEKLAAKDYSGLDGIVDYNEFSQYQINKMNAQDPVQSEIKKLHDKIASLESTTEDNISKQFEAAVEERRIAVKSLLETSANFPRIKKAQAQETVVQHILDTWEHDSVELSIEEAAKEVENVIVERAQSWKALLEDEDSMPDADSIPEPAPEPKKALPPMKQGLRTLSNALTAPNATPQKPLYAMNEQQRYAEARRRAEAKLANR